MEEKETSFRRQTFRRLLRSISIFLKSEVGGKARWLLAGLLLLMLAINGMNVANSYVGRFFMSAIETRDMGGFARYAWLYVAVFAGSTLVGVLFRYTEESLQLLWREWLTRRITGAYIDNRIYLNMTGEDAVSNPDQRMTEDVRHLTTTTLSFLLMILNGSLAAISFSGVLWSISPTLFMTAVLYATAGSALTVWLGRPLVGLNYRQSDRDADFRAELIRTRENADGIALAGKESDIRARLMNGIDGVIGNLRQIIAVNRNLSFFTSGYNYMIQLIPVLIVAPLFIEGKVEFGVIGQSSMAFATLLGALSLVITQFQAISSYASVVSRLGEFVDATEKVAARRTSQRVEIIHEADRFAFRDLTLSSPTQEAVVLVDKLNLEMEAGPQMMVHGASQVGRIALFRACAGLHESGSGTIVRPPPGMVAFIPEQPYLPSSTLRELLVPASASNPVTDDQIHDLLREIGLAALIRQPGGLDVRQSWQDSLSIHETKLLAIAQAILARPRYAFLVEIESAMSEIGRPKVLDLLEAAGTTCVTFGSKRPGPAYRGASLELREDGSWSAQNKS
jgi:putative ATP-binding cassette transporter